MVKKNSCTLLIFILLAFGCNKNSYTDCESYDYSSCNTVEPTDGVLQIIISQENDSSKVPVWLYKGKYGAPEVLIYMDTVSTVEIKFNLSLNKDYYAVAEYVKNGKHIYAVDGTFFKKKGQTICDSTCWTINGDVIDVRLKNQKVQPKPTKGP